MLLSRKQGGVCTHLQGGGPWQSFSSCIFPYQSLPRPPTSTCTQGLLQLAVVLLAAWEVGAGWPETGFDYEGGLQHSMSVYDGSGAAQING